MSNHPYHGLVGDRGVGGLEVISPDPATGQYRTHFFDGEGNVSTQTLSARDGDWYWHGPRTRCKGVFSDGGRTLTAHHERSDDGENWAPSMTVTLRKISTPLAPHLEPAARSTASRPWVGR